MPKIVRPRVYGRPYSMNICRAVDGAPSSFRAGWRDGPARRAAAAPEHDEQDDDERTSASSFIPSYDLTASDRQADPRSAWYRNCLPIVHQMLGGPPRERLGRQRRISRAARAHHRRAKNARGSAPRAKNPSDSTTLVSALSPMRVPPYACVVTPITPTGPRSDLDGAGRPIPLLHLVLNERGKLALVVLVVGGDPAHRQAERIFHRPGSRSR